MRRFLNITETAERYGTTPRALRDKTRKNLIPFTLRPGWKGCMFLPEHLDAWDDGAALEVVELPDGGKLVRPVEPKKAGLHVAA
jgi:hypothetical protein